MWALFFLLKMSISIATKAFTRVKLCALLGDWAVQGGFVSSFHSQDSIGSFDDIQRNMALFLINSMACLPSRGECFSHTVRLNETAFSLRLKS